MTTREGIEVDYCPACRGVWLDRGELDKIIERSASAAGAEAPGRRDRSEDGDRDDDGTGHRRLGGGERDHRGGYGRPRRKSFLDDLFDFG